MSQPSLFPLIIKLFTALLAITLASGKVTAGEATLRISDDALFGNVALDNENGTLSYGGGYFYKDNDSAINIVNLDLHTKGQTALGNLPTTVAIGVQGNYFKEDKLQGSAIGIGGSVRSNLPDTPGLALEVGAHYAPDIIAFGDADAYTRAHLQLNYRIIRTADLTTGYRYLNTSLKTGGHRTFESGIFLGINVNF